MVALLGQPLAALERPAAGALVRAAPRRGWRGFRPSGWLGVLRLGISTENFVGKAQFVR